MSKYQNFIFESYCFDEQTGVISLSYSLDERLKFEEKYFCDFPFSDYNEQVFDRALQGLFFMAGISYFKTFVPPNIVVKQGKLDQKMAEFFSKVYGRGLGEFWFVNKLDPHTNVDFPANTDHIESVTHKGSGQLVGLGGGKDSLVTIEMLKQQSNLATWNCGNHPEILEPLVEVVGLPHFYIKRVVDPLLYEINKKDAYNGHVPVSAILAFVGTVLAVLTGYQDIVVSNEQSANEATLTYKGVSINHQYSKSQDFERDYQSLTKHLFGDSLRYYSFLRPLSELRIAEIFASTGFDKYYEVFSSCNRAFVVGGKEISWCGKCPKCAFAFLALTPFVHRIKLENLWKGKNLLQDPSLDNTYKQLLGISGDKPLDCVGEIEESRSAMHLAFQQYPELKSKYSFDLPSDYDFRKLSSHEMPADVYAKFEVALKNLD